MRSVALFLASCALVACGSIIGVEDRFAGEPDAGPASQEPSPGGDEEESSGPADAGGRGAADAAPDAATAKPQTLGQFVDPEVSYGENELLVLDRASGRSKIVLLPKSNPTKPVTIYDELGDTTAKRVASLALARGKVWFTTVDGKLHTTALDGKNPTIVTAPPSEILARSAGALWLASPDALSNAPTLRWMKQDLLSQVPEAQLAMSGPAMFTDASDDELFVSSRTSAGRWTLSRWRPLATEPYVTFATFDAYPSWVTADSSRAFVYQEDEGNIVSWSRVTPQTTPTTILSNMTKSVRMKSDGKNLVLLSQTSIESCTIADCAGTKHALPTVTSFAKARYLEIDAQWAYFVYAKTDTATMTLTRVPR